MPSFAHIRSLLADRWLPAAVFLVTGIVFLPLLIWLTRHTAAHEQLFHAFIVYLFTGFLLVIQKRIPLAAQWDFSNRVQLLLLAGYALLTIAILLKLAVLSLPAMGLALAAFLLWLLGPAQQRFVLSTSMAFLAFLILAIYLPVLDWPLRSIAGKWSAALLSLIGTDARLGLYQGSNEPMLLLLHGGRPFHVAAECNGFGLLTSSLLMATLIILYRQLSWPDRLLFLVAAVVLGFVFNTIRIVIIILLAPRIPDASYLLMHEIVGLVATYGGLALLYLLLMPANTSSEPTHQQDPCQS